VRLAGQLLFWSVLTKTTNFMKHLLAGLLLMAQLASGQTLDSTRLDSLPGKSNFRISLINDLGMFQPAIFMPNFNAFLKANQIGYTTRAGYHFNYGLGIRVKRVKVTGQVSLPLLFLSGNGRRSGNNGWVVHQQGGFQAGGIVGYDFLNAFSQRIFVYAGAGISGLEFNIYKRSTQAIPFSSVFQSATTSGVGTLAVRNAPYIDFGVERAHRERNDKSIDFVVRIGYRHGLRKNAWISDAHQFTDPIRDRLSQFYVQSLVSISNNYPRKKQP
jgi:hypothetical protein